MELLLQIGLIVGAIFLIGLTVVMVWPDRGAHAVGATSNDSEASASAMNESSQPPQGDRCEDQYTSATADLPAGAVATTFQAEAPALAAWPAADAAGEHIGLAERAENFPFVAQPARARRLMRPRPMSISIGASAVLSLAAAIGGAWLYARWQRRQQQKPINRLRRTQATSTIVLLRMLERAPTRRR